MLTSTTTPGACAVIATTPRSPQRTTTRVAPSGPAASSSLHTYGTRWDRMLIWMPSRHDVHVGYYHAAITVSIGVTWLLVPLEAHWHAVTHSTPPATNNHAVTTCTIGRHGWEMQPGSPAACDRGACKHKTGRLLKETGRKHISKGGRQVCCPGKMANQWRKHEIRRSCD
jgi:hypothetical protein